jgi:uncharacterized protein (TIGR04255 family)
VRYINRLDIPTPTDEPVHLATYLTTFFVRPQIDGLPPNPMADFSLSCTIPLGVDQLKLVLNVASIPSPLVKTTSFVLDLDVSREVDVPQREDVIWEIINRIRGIKNLVFESSITDAARALFTQ